MTENPNQPTEHTTETDDSSPSPALLIFLIMPLVGILIALLTIASEGGGQAALEGVPEVTRNSANNLINYRAPDFELFNMAGELVTLEDYAGKTLFLNFWQTTCVPCIEELPEFADYYADYRDEGVEILAVSFDETSEMVADFLSEHNISGVPIALDPESDVRRSYGVMQIPVTYIIDGEGFVRRMRLGALNYEELELERDVMRYMTDETDAS